MKTDVNKFLLSIIFLGYHEDAIVDAFNLSEESKGHFFCRHGDMNNKERRADGS